MRAILAGFCALAVIGCSADRVPQTAKAPAPAPAPVLPPVMPAAHDAGAAPATPDSASTAAAPATGDDIADQPMPGTDDPNGGSRTPPAGVDPDDVREAIFRHMFGSNASGQQQGAGVYCLEVEGGQDPTSKFLSRLHDVRTPIKAVSRCSASADKGVIDKTTHARGLIFRVETLKFQDAHHATATGGYYEAGLSASGNIYTVELRGSKWVVTKDEMTWIS